MHFEEKSNNKYHLICMVWEPLHDAILPNRNTGAMGQGPYCEVEKKIGIRFEVIAISAAFMHFD